MDGPARWQRNQAEATYPTMQNLVMEITYENTISFRVNIAPCVFQSNISMSTYEATEQSFASTERRHHKFRVNEKRSFNLNKLLLSVPAT